MYHPSLPALYLNLNDYTVFKNARRLRGEEKKSHLHKALINIALQLAVEVLKI
jgi:hypothetical protein